jgi:hypothetical protein
MTKLGKMSTKYKVWVFKFTQDFSRICAKLQKDKNDD